MRSLAVFGLAPVAALVVAGNTAQAAKARADAAAQLNKLASQVRAAGGTADDPAVQDAAVKTADQIATLAADTTTLSGVKSASDVPPVIEKVTRATDELNKVCI